MTGKVLSQFGHVAASRIYWQIQNRPQPLGAVCSDELLRNGKSEEMILLWSSQSSKLIEKRAPVKNAMTERF